MVEIVLRLLAAFTTTYISSHLFSTLSFNNVSLLLSQLIFQPFDLLVIVFCFFVGFLLFSVTWKKFAKQLYLMIKEKEKVKLEMIFELFLSLSFFTILFMIHFWFILCMFLISMYYGIATNKWKEMSSNREVVNLLENKNK